MPEQKSFQAHFHRLGLEPDGYNKETPWSTCLNTDREMLAKALTRKFQISPNPFVIAINSEWGSGKSLFLRMWKDWLNISEKVQGKEFPPACIYFDAWKYDYTGDPLLSFAASMSTQIAELHLPKEEKQLLESGKGFLVKNKVLLGRLGWLTANIATGGQAGSAAEDLINELIGGLEEGRDEREKCIKHFKEVGQKVYGATGTPLIVMVDELDRCKPSFAVALLEAIKHLFCVEGIVFVLALQRQQLCNSFESVYGLKGYQANEYLGKFVDSIIELPQIPVLIFCSQLTKSLYPIKIPDYFHAPRSPVYQLNFKELLLEFIVREDESNSIQKDDIVFDLSLRKAGQLFNKISLLSAMPNISLLTFLVCSKILYLQEVTLFSPQKILDNIAKISVRSVFMEDFSGTAYAYYSELFLRAIRLFLCTAIKDFDDNKIQALCLRDGFANSIFNEHAGLHGAAWEKHILQCLCFIEKADLA